MAPMRLPARAWLGVASVGSLLAATCSGSPETAIAVSAITPASAYNNRKVDLVIQGGPFRPAYDIDTGDGRAATRLSAFTAYLAPRDPGGQRIPVESLTWLSTTALSAQLREDIPQGEYDVVVQDPRGATAELEAGFSSLGRDLMPPKAEILEPEDGTAVNPSAEVPVVVHSKDAPGALGAMRWTVSSPGVDPITGTCPPMTLGATEDTCRFVFVVPPTLASGAILNLNVEVTDAAENSDRLVRTLIVGIKPGVKGFTPAEGPAEGGAEILIEGDNFITGSPGTQVFVGGTLIEPNGGTVRDEHHIVGMTPAHDPGVFPVVVRTGGSSVKAQGMYAFVGRPLVLAVIPTSGPTTGGTFVTIVGKEFRDETVFRFGTDFPTSLPLLCPVLVGPNRIEGYTPPGMGAASIFALDQVSGTSERPLAFTFLPDESPDASPLVTPPCLSPDGGIP
jgi:hypothetical protein